MEHLLRQLAEQLDSLDEVSLMGLWDKYALRTQSYVPSRDWEIDVLVFCLIQAKRMKNQLFNCCLAHQDELPSKSPGKGAGPADMPGHRHNDPQGQVPLTTAQKWDLLREFMSRQQGGADRERKPGVVLRFNPDAGRK